MTMPGRRLLVADEQLDERALARAGGPDEEDEVALRDDQVDVDQGALAVRVDLGHVVQREGHPLEVGQLHVDSRPRTLAAPGAGR